MLENVPRHRVQFVHLFDEVVDDIKCKVRQKGALEVEILSVRIGLILRQLRWCWVLRQKIS